MSSLTPTASLFERQRLLIVEDHAVVRAGLMAEFTTGIPPGRLCFAATEKEARDALPQFQPTLCLVDLLLGGGRCLSDSISLIEDLNNSGENVRVLVYSALEDADLARRAMAAGARGYIVKSEPLENLRVAFDVLLADRFYLSPSVFVSLTRETSRSPTLALDPRFALLTNRERHVLHSTALGLPNRRIATDLGLSVKTIESHKESVKRKLTLDHAAELELMADAYLAALLGVGAS